MSIVNGIHNAVLDCLKWFFMDGSSLNKIRNDKQRLKHYNQRIDFQWRDMVIGDQNLIETIGLN